jgi:integrase
MHLKWDDFDLDRSGLTVRGELGKSHHEQRGRVVPISPDLVQELSGGGRQEGYLISSQRQRGGPRERMFRARDMGRDWQRAEVPERAWSGRPNHAFSKGFTTGMHQLGADLVAVEYLMGRKLPGQLDTYLASADLSLDEAVALIPVLGGTADAASLDLAHFRWTS